jgi:hypothetical protein
MKNKSVSKALESLQISPNPEETPIETLIVIDQVITDVENLNAPKLIPQIEDLAYKGKVNSMEQIKKFERENEKAKRILEEIKEEKLKKMEIYNSKNLKLNDDGKGLFLQPDINHLGDFPSGQSDTKVVIRRSNITRPLTQQQGGKKRFYNYSIKFITNPNTYGNFKFRSPLLGALVTTNPRGHIPAKFVNFQTLDQALYYCKEHGLEFILENMPDEGILMSWPHDRYFRTPKMGNVVESFDK